MYVTGPNSIYALDALNGREIWHFRRPRTPNLTGDGATGINRGVAVLGDKVFLVTDNAHLLAVNRITGHVVWEQTMPKEHQFYGGTSAPLVVKDLVITGVAARTKASADLSSPTVPTPAKRFGGTGPFP